MVQVCFSWCLGRSGKGPVGGWFAKTLALVEKIGNNGMVEPLVLGVVEDLIGAVLVGLQLELCRLAPCRQGGGLQRVVLCVFGRRVVWSLVVAEPVVTRAF